ncbi:MAG: S1 RNA-binding domain-containing protein [Oscillospiraceae bacterium]|nr:S1 RNA-binding domain-containing protein [Oscillospiraceae bacterium]
MELTVGTILEGKVKTITNFGAVVALPDGTTGLVHISEVARTFVNDIHEHLTEGQDVKVMVIGTENGKINLSIKRALAPAPAAPRRDAPKAQKAPSGPPTFDDMVKRFLADSDSKISGVRQYEHKTKTRRR